MKPEPKQETYYDPVLKTMKRRAAKYPLIVNNTSRQGDQHLLIANDVKVDTIDELNALKVHGMVNPLVWWRTLRHAFQPTEPK